MNKIGPLFRINVESCILVIRTDYSKYDGTSWKFIKTTNPDIVRSLAVDESNTVFIGGYNYFGRLETDSTNQLIFKSLSDKLDPKYKKFNNVWDINVAGDGVFFQTDSALFKWTDNKFEIWKTTNPGNRSFLIRDTLYRIEKEMGLTYLKDSIFVKISGGKFFTHNKIYSMKPFGKNKSIIGTRSKGLFIYSNNTIIPFKTEIDQYLKEGKLTDIVLLNDGNIVISTRENGFSIINQHGRLIQQINKEKGLADNTIWDMHPDNQFGLWLALNNGVSRVELPSPVTYLNETSGIEGTVESITGHQGSVYIATTLGLYFLNPDQKSSRIQKVPGFRPYKIISAGKTLIASGYSSGIYEFKNNKIKFINNYSGYSFCRSQVDSNRIYIGLKDAIASIYHKGDRWTDEGHLQLNSLPIREIIETQEGHLWLRPSGPILCKIDFAERKFSWQKATVEYYDEKNGLIPSEQNYICRLGDKVFFTNKNRLLLLNDHEKQFIPYTELMDIISDTSYSVYGVNNDIKNNIWILLNRGAGYSVAMASRDQNGKYVFKTAPFLQLSGRYFYSIYPDRTQENVVWFGGADGLIRYDSNIKKDYDLSYPCLIRRVTTKKDSLIWPGTMLNSQIESKAVSLEYHHNALRFEFAAAFYENEKANFFQHYLEGFDKNWSKWTDETKADYTNIPEGRYIFHVRARNIYNIISKEAIFLFKILPPWYRTWWAYGIYIFIVFGMVLGLIKLRSLKLEHEKIELEKIIDERTDEIQIKNKQLEQQAEKLKEMDEIKSRFFANISHEFRTPLTLIKGPAEEMLNKSYRGKPEKAFNLIVRNANRLLQLINQLLDLSKLESGSMKLNASLQPLSSFINIMVSSFLSLAESRNILLQYIKPQEEIEIYFDRDKLEKIICNLLSNAFKFTPENGYITIALNSIKTNLYTQGAVEISVHDSGIGIPKNDLDQIFNRFVQGHNSGNNRIEGSGIGLALTKELVELHHGKITVASNAEEGTEFDVILPLGKDHLQPEDIIEPDESIETTGSSLQLDIAGLSSEIRIKPINDQQLTSSEKNLVLIVEDNSEVRNYIKESLEQDYEIMEAENGASGLKFAQDQLPDLIISDVMMPEIDGYELTDTLKKAPLTSHIPIILLTAKASDEAKIEGLESGVDAYMAKPFNTKELEVRVKKLIENRIKLREKFRKEFILESTEIKPVSLDDEFIKQVYDTIEEKMANPEFNKEALLNDFAMGQRQFTRKLVALTGQTPVQFIRVMRLKRAMKLIRQGAGTVSQIAFEVGFCNLSYFSKCFRIHFGKLPSEISEENQMS